MRRLRLRLRLTPLRLAVAVLVGVVACTGVAYAASLGVSSGKLFAWSQTLTKASCDQTSTTEDDTFVQQASATKTNASATTLTISGKANQAQYAFIRFDLSGCSLPTTAGADSAALTVTVTTTAPDTISLYPVYTTWSSSTLNWNGVSGLTIGSTATTSFVPSKKQAYTLTVTADVDAAIKAGALYGWVLKDTSGGGAPAIASANNGTAGSRPSMTLAYEK